MLYFNSLYSKPWCQIESNAFLKSTKQVLKKFDLGGKWATFQFKAQNVLLTYREGWKGGGVVHHSQELKF